MYVHSTTGRGPKIVCYARAYTNLQTIFFKKTSVIGWDINNKIIHLHLSQKASKTTLEPITIYVRYKHRRGHMDIKSKKRKFTC